MKILRNKEYNNINKTKYSDGIHIISFILISYFPHFSSSILENNSYYRNIIRESVRVQESEIV